MTILKSNDERLATSILRLFEKEQALKDLEKKGINSGDAYDKSVIALNKAKRINDYMKSNLKREKLKKPAYVLKLPRLVGR